MQGNYDDIVLVGHSMGALITRKAFLFGLAKTDDQDEKEPVTGWAKKVKRIVLMAGMNRGWDITGQRPLDMGWGRYAQFWIGSWFGELTGTGELAQQTESGAPFVGNLRLEWMRWAKTNRDVHVVQLLGDIDDIVSDTDNKDLRTAGSKNFTWIRVRGTGHSDIIRLDDRTKEYEDCGEIGEYRKKKFLLAATHPNEGLAAISEEQPFEPDTEVTHVVFVLHGIRDEGRW